MKDRKGKAFAKIDPLAGVSIATEVMGLGLKKRWKKRLLKPFKYRLVLN